MKFLLTPRIRLARTLAQILPPKVAKTEGTIAKKSRFKIHTTERKAKKLNAHLMKQQTPDSILLTDLEVPKLSLVKTLKILQLSWIDP
jgi:hypothetical protein